MICGISPSCWYHYRQDDLAGLMADHKMLFPDFKPPKAGFEPKLRPWEQAGVEYTDPWGCVWKSADDGIVGTVIKHPLGSWDDFDGYQMPDPAKYNLMEPMDWNQQAEMIEQWKRTDQLRLEGLQHGHTFLKLCDIRGYQNLMFDMADGEPRLFELIKMLEAFNLYTIKRYIELGIEYVKYPEDLGMQVGPMLSPEHFRKYIKPTYQRMMAPAIEAGCIVYMHSDGDIRTLVDDLIVAGVDVMNLQDLVNGIDWIKTNLKGKVCIDLDIDRQDITVNGTPQQIDALIASEVKELGSRDGGLIMRYGLYPGVPLENAKAVMDAMEKYAGHYS